ncbi:MAG: phosphoribosyl carboxyaminoimidazole mutase [Pirellulaceae bacterium]|nr:MAG: phosphoribosyl carboxyaminoimidazole mutase [Pirellulaceae bacterium]
MSDRTNFPNPAGRASNMGTGSQDSRLEGRSTTEVVEQAQCWWEAARAGQLSWGELAERLWTVHYQISEGHHPDGDRQRRCGFGEVIFGERKSAAAIITIAQRLLDSGQDEVLITRLDSSTASEVGRAFPDMRYLPEARMARMGRAEVLPVRKFRSSPLAASVFAPPPLPSPAPPREPAGAELPLPPVAIVSGGSTDAPITAEAAETLRWMGIDPDVIQDVGVAGPYRLIPYLPRLRQCAAVVVVAGMEGALASVVGGQVPCPVIAVPTSVGYGAHLHGMTTLLSMLSSCAAGVTAVNIDGGFKGGYLAGLISHQVAWRLLQVVDHHGGQT